jgi:glucose-1-phosphate adenylyltransferase
MNYGKLIESHVTNNADLTIGVLRVTVKEASNRFGVMELGGDSRVVGFEEKPDQPRPIAGDAEHCYASMGIYVFTTRFLFEQLCQDATRPGSHHDFGGDVIPSIINTHRVFAYPFLDENRKRDAYWRDVGTLDAYYEANMDLIAVDPELNIYDDQWPLRTLQPNLPPPKFVFAAEDRRGYATDSIVCLGSIISGGRIHRSIIGSNARINSYAQVEDSILFEGVDIGRRVKVRRAIIDKGVCLPAGFEVGYDHELDRRRGFTITDNGVTVIAKTDGVEHLLGLDTKTEIRAEVPRPAHLRPATRMASS